MGFWQDTLAKASQLDRKALVQRLMEIIAAPADPEGLGEPQFAEECAFNPGEAASLAAHLLNMLLDLYGEIICASSVGGGSMNWSSTPYASCSVEIELSRHVSTCLSQVLATLPTTG